MEIKEIQNLIKFVAKSGAHEVKLETDDFKITIKTNSDAPVAETSTTLQTLPGVVVQASQPTVLPKEAEAPEKLESQPDKIETDNLITIKSPMIGTFYRKPSPEKDVFIEVDKILGYMSILAIPSAVMDPSKKVER